MSNHEVISILESVKEQYSQDTVMQKALRIAIRAVESQTAYCTMAGRPKNMIHIDDVYRLIAGHSDYHGDSILSAFTCLVEGKDVKPIAPLDESADRPTGEWQMLERDENVYDLKGVPSWGVNYMCDQCGFIHTAIEDHMAQYNFCPNCGADMRGEDDGSCE